MMMSKEEMLKLWDEVKANHKSLHECVGPHDFVEAESRAAWDKKFRCLKCGGVIRSEAHEWYKLGLKHGGRG